MAILRAAPLLPVSHSKNHSNTTARITPLPRTPRIPILLKNHGITKKYAKNLARRGKISCCLPTREEKGEEIGVAGDGAGEQYLVREFGWGVRRMGRVGEELRRVALVQAEAFHIPVALFNDFFFEFFKAEVLSALIYRVRNSPPDRYACLVAEDADVSQPFQAPFERIVGVVDCTVQNEDDILKHLGGAQDYLYVSGIAVLPAFRRQKVGTVLLKASEVLALEWKYRFMVLRAYEDDQGARGLYSKAGYSVVSRDPFWVTWVGRRRRVLMIKELPIYDQAE